MTAKEKTTIIKKETKPVKPELGRFGKSVFYEKYLVTPGVAIG